MEQAGVPSWPGNQIPQATTKTPCSQINKYILKKKKRNQAQDKWLVYALTLGQWNTRVLTPNFLPFFFPLITKPLPLGSLEYVPGTLHVTFPFIFTEMNYHPTLHMRKWRPKLHSKHRTWNYDHLIQSTCPPLPITPSISDLPKRYLNNDKNLHAIILGSTISDLTILMFIKILRGR